MTPGAPLEVGSDDDAVLRIERFMTCDKCVAYEMRSYADGAMRVHGKDAALMLGVFDTRNARKKHPSAELAQRVKEAAENIIAADFFNLPDSLVDHSISNVPEVELTLSYAGRRKTVRFQETPATRKDILSMVLHFESLGRNLSFLHNAKIFTSPFFATKDGWLVLRRGDPSANGKQLILYRDGRVFYAGTPRCPEVQTRFHFAQRAWLIDKAAMRSIEHSLLDYGFPDNIPPHKGNIYSNIPGESFYYRAIDGKVTFGLTLGRHSPLPEMRALIDSTLNLEKNECAMVSAAEKQANK